MPKLNRVKQSPTGLTGIESIGFPEILEVFVVCDDGEGMVSSLQPMPPLFQDQFNGQQLPVADVEVLLRWGKFLRVVCTRLEAWMLAELLGQHGSSPVGEASTSTTNGTWGSGCQRMGDMLNADLSFSKASWVLKLQDRDLGLPRWSMGLYAD